jgi:hypothetical protein
MLLTNCYGGPLQCGGQMRAVLIQSIRAMVQAGFTPPKRCWILAGAARTVFQIPTLGSSKKPLQQRPPPDQHVEGTEQKVVMKKEEL